MESLKKSLQTLGISNREADVYVSLLQKEELTAPEIAKISTVSLSKIYEVLQNLVKKEMCNEKYKDGVKVFSAIEPKIALENILSTFETELNNKRLMAQDFEKSLTLIYNNKEFKEQPLDYIEVISDKGQLKERYINIELNTEKELLAFSKPPYALPLEENIENQIQIQKPVIIKSIYEYKEYKTLAEKNELIETVRSYQNMGEVVRFIKELPMKFVISDETVVVFSLEDRVSSNLGLTSVIINHPAFAGLIKQNFEIYWNNGMTLEEYEKQVLLEEEPKN